MNEVETFAQAGKRAGAALGSGVQTARKARDATQAALAQRWGVTQDVLAERLHEARHELATRIEPRSEPKPAYRRHWWWLVLTFLVIGGAVGAAVLARRPQEIEPDPLPLRPVREPGSRDSDPAAGGDPDAIAGSPTSNGMVGVERPSASTD